MLEGGNLGWGGVGNPRATPLSMKYYGNWYLVQMPASAPIYMVKLCTIVYYCVPLSHYVYMCMCYTLNFFVTRGQVKTDECSSK